MKNFVSIFLLLLIGWAYIFPSESESQWEKTNFPYTTYISCFAVLDTNLFAGTLYAGVYRTTNNGTSWEEIDSGLSSLNIYAMAIVDTDLFVGTGGGVFLSTNKGKNWTHAGLESNGIISFAVLGTNIFAGDYYYGVFLSPNNGSTWTQIDSTIIGYGITALAVLDTNIFIGIELGGVYRSTNNGTTWIQVNSGLTNLTIDCFAFVGQNLFAGTDGDGVFLTTDNGTKWAQTGLNFGYVYALAVSGTNLFAGPTVKGAFLSTDNGTSWTDVTIGLTDTTINVLAVSDSNLFLGTEGGVWRRPLREMITSVGTSLSKLPAHISLEQNYPNPFNPSTTIQYQLPSNSRVSLKVYNLLGQVLTTLTNKTETAGYKSVTWNAASFASGIYFYRLEATSIANPSKTFTSVRKMLLLK
jgi:photosystem II stability/assembly factor-like uncharacterized protein